jgi:ribosomal protein S1
LLHISRLGGGKKVKSAGEAVAVGQEVLVKVESADPVRRRIALSLVGAEEQEGSGGEEEDYRKYLDKPSGGEGIGALGEAIREKIGEKKGK